MIAHMAELCLFYGIIFSVMSTTCSCVDGTYYRSSKLLVWAMLLISISLKVTLLTITNVVILTEVNMTAILVMSVVAGAALLGRSGDIFPKLQGSGLSNASLIVDIREQRRGFDSPFAPPS